MDSILALIVLAAAAPAVGSVAPDFTLPSNTGKDISLSDLLKKAKHTVLYFYPGEFESLALNCPEFMASSHAKAGTHGLIPERKREGY